MRIFFIKFFIQQSRNAIVLSLCIILSCLNVGCNDAMIDREKSNNNNRSKAQQPLKKYDKKEITEYYNILGLREEDQPDKDEIRKAYYALARECHPDKNPNDKEAATKRFLEITEAYNELLEYIGEK